jgi:hypothetical protein
MEGGHKIGHSRGALSRTPHHTKGEHPPRPVDESELALTRHSGTVGPSNAQLVRKNLPSEKDVTVAQSGKLAVL